MKEFPIEEIKQHTVDYAKLIDLWIFSERDRAIMKRKLIDAVTFEQIAEEFGMSPHGVFDIVKKGRKILLKHI